MFSLVWFISESDEEKDEGSQGDHKQLLPQQLGQVAGQKQHLQAS